MSWGDKFTTMGLLPFEKEVIKVRSVDAKNRGN